MLEPLDIFIKMEDGTCRYRFALRSRAHVAPGVTGLHGLLERLPRQVACQ
jgi:hypothetical protein